MKLAAVFILAAALVISLSGPVGAQAPGPTLMTENGIGPIRVGMTVAQINALGLPTRPAIEHIEEETRQRLDVTVTPGAIISAVLSVDASRGAYAVSTASPAFATANGARVGMTFEEIQRRHPGGARKLDDEVRGALIYELPASKATFEFDLKNVPRGCFYPDDRCSTPGPACNIVHKACADAWINKKAQRFVAYASPARKSS